VEDTSLKLLKDYEPEAIGLEIPERLFREVFVQRADVTRTGDWQTGRPSQPAFMDMNLNTLRDAKAQPRAVIWQHDNEDCFNPCGLLMAYEEEKVKPVVSDFDPFVLGCAGPMNFQPLPPGQVELVKWSLRQIEDVLATPGTSGWTGRWLETLKRASDKGFHPEMPRYGFGDPTSHDIVGEFVAATNLLGAVRHGAECFNFYFPQDLDEEFLVVSSTFGAQPWRYMKEPELREFLMDSISQGYSFPLNPKWIICDAGWREVFEKLRENEESRKHLACWFPPDSGLIETIDELCQKFPDGFIKPAGAVEIDVDLAEFQLKRYQTLQRARRKLRVVLRWMDKTPKKDKDGTGEERLATNQGSPESRRVAWAAPEDSPEQSNGKKKEETTKPGKKKRSCFGIFGCWSSKSTVNPE
ncbi:unnamed protein product, partial [Durusdinium trenchii]